MSEHKTKSIIEKFEKDFEGYFHPASFGKTPCGGQYIKSDTYLAFDSYVKGIKSVKINVPQTSIRWRDANTAKLEDILNAEIDMRNKFISACREAGIEPIFAGDIEP